MTVKKENEQIQRIIDSWERGEPLTPDDAAVINRELTREDLSPETKTLLSFIRRDTGYAEPIDIAGEASTVTGEAADQNAVNDIMDRIERDDVDRFRPDRVNRISRIGFSIGAAAAGIAMLIGAVALLLRVTGVGGPVPASVAEISWAESVSDSTDAGRSAESSDGMQPVASPGIVGREGDSPEDVTLIVRFELVAPEARSVSLVGDFNDWDPERNPLMDPNKDGVWEVKIRVQQDEVYTYNFLVNGEEWIPDPNAVKHIRDSFGGRKSVLSL